MNKAGGFVSKGLVMRILIYILGLFFLAMGVAFSINSNLGVSPVNSLPYVISQVLGMPLSRCVIAVFSVYILLQILILRRRFQWIQLSQIIFSMIFGYFTTFSKWIVGDFVIPTYPGRLVMLAISIVFIAVGVVLYIEVKLVPMPMEGLSLAIADKIKMPFHNTKVMIDCSVVAIAIILSLTCFRSLVGIREGTVITAMVTGKVMIPVRKLLLPKIQRLCFSTGKKKSGENLAA